MRLKYLAILAIATVFIISLIKEVSPNQPETQTSVASLSTASVAESRKFQIGEDRTQGTVNLITEQGKRYLEFDHNFKTDPESDLFVILHRFNATFGYASLQR